MEAIAPRPERVADDRLSHRPRESQGRRRRIRGERPERRGPGDPVDVHARPLLEAAQCGLHTGTEDPVERPRRKSVEGELELKRRDAPADQPPPKRPRAERMPAETAERCTTKTIG